MGFACLSPECPPSLLQISVKDIEDFEKTYKDSEQELADVKAAYMDFEGDMDKIMESVLCVDYTDEPRIRKIIEKAIDLKEVPSYKAFLKEPKQKALARKRRVSTNHKETLYMISIYSPSVEISEIVFKTNVCHRIAGLQILLSIFDHHHKSPVLPKSPPKILFPLISIKLL